MLQYRYKPPPIFGQHLNFIRISLYMLSFAGSAVLSVQSLLFLSFGNFTCPYLPNSWTLCIQQMSPYLPKVVFWIIFQKLKINGIRSSTVVLKINASKHKSQIRISQKLSGFSKKILLNFLEILFSLQLFSLETSTVKLAKFTKSRFWTILAEIGSFSPFLILFENVVRQSLHS